ncbi:hypothetical protein NDU88_000381 [Pleurodeles waltl]|uniref:Uncharacterized protein n=1 Tax=Pleurodeles waltl TaxID=8319 RepID=A0AAV7U6Y8_PLEWA|nr:hypothetical protein NDU88_000381 [Pleurodeles waltl]
MAPGTIAKLMWRPETCLPRLSRRSWLRAERGPGQPEVKASGCEPELRGIAGHSRPLGNVVPSGRAWKEKLCG